MKKYITAICPSCSEQSVAFKHCTKCGALLSLPFPKATKDNTADGVMIKCVSCGKDTIEDVCCMQCGQSPKLKVADIADIPVVTDETPTTKRSRKHKSDFDIPDMPELPSVDF